MSEERRRILRLLEKGKITAEEADRLLSALGEEKGGKTLRVLVYKPGRESPKTRIELPLSWAKWALRFIPQKELRKRGIEPELLTEAITKDLKGKIIDVESEEEKVEVYII